MSDIAVPTLAIADQGDGTGATATIGNSSIGSTNTVYVQSLGAEFVSKGSRTGNGTVDLSLGLGFCLAYVHSELGAQSQNSIPAYFRVSDSTAARLTTIANAIVDALNTQQFGFDFTAQRLYRPEVRLQEEPSGDPLVFVRPVNVVKELLGVSTWSTEYHCDVIVARRLEDFADPESVDPLIDMLEDIADYLLGTSLDSEASQTETQLAGEGEACYDVESLYERNAFLGIVRVIAKQVGGTS